MVGEGRGWGVRDVRKWGTTAVFATVPFHLVLFSAAVVELAKSIPVLVLNTDVSPLFLSSPPFSFHFT